MEFICAIKFQQGWDCMTICTSPFSAWDFEKLTIKDRRRTVEIIKSTISKMIIDVEGKTGKIEIDDENIDAQDDSDN